MVILGYIASIGSALFSLYKFRLTILVRIERLKQRGIKPTLKRLVFLEQALSDRDKQMINLTEMNYSEEADAATVSLIRDHQIQMSREYLELKQEVQDLKSQLHQRQRSSSCRSLLISARFASRHPSQTNGRTT